MRCHYRPKWQRFFPPGYYVRKRRCKMTSQKNARLAIVPDGQNPNVRDIFSTGSGRADFQVQAQRSFLDIDRNTFSRYRRKDVCLPCCNICRSGEDSTESNPQEPTVRVEQSLFDWYTKADRKWLNMQMRFWRGDHIQNTDNLLLFHDAVTMRLKKETKWKEANVRLSCFLMARRSQDSISPIATARRRTWWGGKPLTRGNCRISQISKHKQQGTPTRWIGNTLLSYGTSSPLPV